MRVILTRHYQTQANAAGRIIGWGDSPPCPHWRDEVDSIDSRLRAHGVVFDAVYCSDLLRARNTASAHAQYFDVAEITPIEDLREINYGQLQGKTKTWAYQNFPGHKKNPDLVYPEGESFRQMQQRGVRSLCSIASSHASDTALLVSHAGMIRGIVSHFLGLDYAANLQQKIPFDYIGDFRLEGDACLCYDELGQTSGFVSNGVIETPVTRDYAIT